MNDDKNSVKAEKEHGGILRSKSQAAPELDADQWLVITDIAPVEGQIVETKIDDANGSRNQPTHYRKPLATDVEKELGRLSTKAGAFEEIKKRLAATETRHGQATPTSEASG